MTTTKGIRDWINKAYLKNQEPKTRKRNEPICNNFNADFVQEVITIKIDNEVSGKQREYDSMVERIIGLVFYFLFLPAATC